MALTNRSPKGVLIALICTALLAGCDSGPDPTEALERARTAFENDDLDAAVVELKNSLQADPKNAESRWLLGSIYLKLGQAASAFKELEKAAGLGMKSDELTVALLRSRLLQRQYEEVLKELPKAALAGDAATLLVLRGEAQLGLRDAAKARSAFERALESDPNSTAAKRGLARIALADRELDDAARLLDAVLAANADDVEAQMLKGELELMRGSFEAAAAAFESARKGTSNSPGATIGLVRAFIGQRKAKEAQALLEALRSTLPKSPVVNYFRAVAAQQLGETDKALEALREVLRVQPNHSQSLLLIGSIEYDRKDYRQAEDNLSRFLGAAPEHIPARKLLAAVHLQLKQVNEAIRILEPVVTPTTEDVQLIAMLGSALLSGGEVSRGTELLERAAILDPTAAAIRTQLALSQLAGGSSGDAVESLQHAVDLDPSFTRADLLLIFTHLRNRQWDQAIKAAEALAAKRADDPVPFNLLGAAYTGKGEAEKARQQYEKALELKPDFINARLNIAALDAKLGRNDEARLTYQALLDANPALEQASIGLARIASATNDGVEAMRVLEAARRADANSLQSRLLLAQVYQRAGDLKRAFAVAEEASRIAPKDPRVRLALGRAYTAGGDADRAVGILLPLSEEQPNSPVVHFQLAVARLRAGDPAGGRQSLNRTLELQPTHYGALLGLGELESLEGNTEAALALVDKVDELAPGAQGAAVLRGDVLVRDGQAEAAVEAYRAALQAAPNGRIALKLHGALQVAGKTAEARETLEDWMEKYPNDDGIRLALASIDQLQGKGEAAIEDYERVLRTSPDSVVALNNAAWLYFEKGDPRGLEYAKRAYDLAPRLPAVADTYAWFLVETGRVQQGLSILKRAARDASDNLEIQYHLAVALAKSGERDSARPILERIVAVTQELPYKDAALRLLKSL